MRLCVCSIGCSLPFVFLGKQALTGAVGLTDWQSGTKTSRGQKRDDLGQNYDN